MSRRRRTPAEQFDYDQIGRIIRGGTLAIRLSSGDVMFRCGRHHTRLDGSPQWHWTGSLDGRRDITEAARRLVAASSATVAVLDTGAVVMLS